jgi:hypothetical protein
MRGLKAASYDYRGLLERVIKELFSRYKHHCEIHAVPESVITESSPFSQTNLPDGLSYHAQSRASGQQEVTLLEALAFNAGMLAVVMAEFDEIKTITDPKEREMARKQMCYRKLRGDVSNNLCGCV